MWYRFRSRTEKTYTTALMMPMKNAPSSRTVAQFAVMPTSPAKMLLSVVERSICRRPSACKYATRVPARPETPPEIAVITIARAATVVCPTKKDTEHPLKPNQPNLFRRRRMKANICLLRLAAIGTHEGRNNKTQSNSSSHLTIGSEFLESAGLVIGPQALFCSLER